MNKFTPEQTKALYLEIADYIEEYPSRYSQQHFKRTTERNSRCILGIALFLAKDSDGKALFTETVNDYSTGFWNYHLASGSSNTYIGGRYAGQVLLNLDEFVYECLFPSVLKTVDDMTVPVLLRKIANGATLGDVLIEYSETQKSYCPCPAPAPESPDRTELSAIVPETITISFKMRTETLRRAGDKQNIFGAIDLIALRAAQEAYDALPKPIVTRELRVDDQYETANSGIIWTVERIYGDGIVLTIGDGYARRVKRSDLNGIELLTREIVSND